MRKRRYEMLLPLAYNDGRLVEPEKHEKTHEELVTRFGALSRMPATLRGVWVHEGQRFEEDFIRLFVDVPDKAREPPVPCAAQEDSLKAIRPG